MNRLNIETKVRSLQSILLDIKNGSIHIPSFQRDYVWSRDDIKNLFDSIKRKYPIGAVLFWSPDNDLGGFKEKIGSYYVAKKTINLTYILDGYQRLSTLFGCLSNPERIDLKRDFGEWKEFFELYFDLDEDVFTYLRNNVEPKPYQIPVYLLMNSSDFRKYARQNFEQINDESLINKYYDRADDLSRTFSDYQIALVDISNATIEEAVEIFSRVNSKGQDISYDWMANALSYSQTFSFKEVIDELIENLSIYNYSSIERNIIFRCIQSSFGQLYIDNTDIEYLAKRSDFKDVTLNTIPYIKKAVEFLYEELLVFEPKLIPYNIQLIFVMEFFRQIKSPTLTQIDELKRWFWFTSYSNYFTIYSLSNQRKAYEHFIEFLKGKINNAIYLDSKIKFTTASFPQKLSLGSVRSKTLLLFLLNYSNNFRSVDHRKVYGYILEHLFPGNIKEISNIIPIFLTKESIGLNRKVHKNNFLRSLLEESLFNIDNDLGRYFLNANYSSILNNSDSNIIFILKERLHEIIKAEKLFVSELGLDYFEIDKTEL